MSEIEGKASARKIIDDIVKEYDNLELLSRLCFYTYFVPRNGQTLNWRLRELPFVEFLGGLCLSQSYGQGKQPSREIMDNLINAIESYFDNDVRSFIGKPSDDNNFGKEHLVHMTRLQKILGQVNAGGYESQISGLAKDIFGKMDDYFLNAFGFTIADVLDFQQKLKARLERKYNARMKSAKERTTKLKEELRDPSMSAEIRKECTEKGVTGDEFIESIGYSTVFENSKDLLVLNAESFCKEEEIQNRDRLEKYLATFSSKFGDQLEEINSVLDDIITFTKPFINLDKGNYLTPFLFIFKNPYSLFRALLEEEKRNNTRIWTRYKDIRSKHIEKLVLEYLSRIFGKDTVKTNLYFHHKNKRNEIDCLVQYDDRIFLIESKSGEFTEPAKRGGLERLKSNLDELVAKAYMQAQNAMEYICSRDYAEFTDDKGKITYKVTLKSKEITFFLVNVTLEPLWYLSIGIQSLETLGLLKNDYPWSVNIFDLDVITKIITSPSIFVHYVQKRLDPQRIDLYLTADELDLLQVYLYVGNFYPPRQENQRIKIVLGGFSDNFDNHFLFGRKPPQLYIEPEWLKLIKEIELKQPPRFLRMTSALLDLDHENRKIIISKFKKITRKSIKDRNPHNFLSMEQDGDTGFSFVCVYRDKDLDYLLFSGSEECIKQYNKRVWIGIGRDVSQKEKIATSFYYSESNEAPQNEPSRITQSKPDAL